MHDETPLRITALREDITARLRPVCADWPDQIFDDMVEHLTALTLKYEDLVSAGMYDRRKTDRLVAEMKKLLERSQDVRRSRHEPG